ncbi:hypothetical protein [Streptomyces sp. NPDC001914]|uniref:hypothetical protein n=1 Tax=Streptomyces sp. NPDC001914 TaxID=3364623 RepID=UPI0036B81605
MAVDEGLLWDAEDKTMLTVPRLRRMAVTAGGVVLLGLVLWVNSHARWAICTVAAYVVVEIAYWVWDRRRLVEARIVVGEDGGDGRLRLRHAGGRSTEHDPRQVTRVLVIHDNVVDSAKLRLRLRGKRLLFARPGHSPAPATWRNACPSAKVDDRGAHWGMPGVPD